MGVPRQLVLFFQRLVIHPVRINVSYSSSVATEKRGGEGGGEGGGVGGGDAAGVGDEATPLPLKKLLRALGLTFLNIDDAPLRLNGLRGNGQRRTPQIPHQERWRAG
jgi:hypothetical protein